MTTTTQGQTAPTTAPQTAPVDVSDCIAMGLPASAWPSATARAQDAHLSPWDGACAVLGESPDDVIFRIDQAVEGLQWAESLFTAIDALAGESAGAGAGANLMHIRRLAGVGGFIAGRIGTDAWDWGEELRARVRNVRAADTAKGGVQ